MKNTLTLLFICLNLACGTKTKQVQETVNTQEVIVMNAPFNIEFQFEEKEAGVFSLATILELDSGSYVISPFSEDEFYGAFQISILDSTHLFVDESLVEIPKSVEEYDPFINVPVRFVRENTVYKQNIKLLSEEDFEVSGIIEFVLEPSCKPYSVEFILSYCSDTLHVEKTNTAVNYKIYQ
jgi:hypothetical protein